MLMRTSYTQFGCRKFKEWLILYQMEAFNMYYRFHGIQNMQTHIITSTLKYTSFKSFLSLLESCKLTCEHSFKIRII